LKCSHCDSEAITFIRYNGSHLCASHFRRYVEKRVKREIRRQVELRRGDVLAVAVSGGKDSMVTLHLLHHILKGKVELDIHCLTVDEGISGYRPQSIEKVEDICAKLDIPHHLLKMEDSCGRGMDEIAPQTGDSTPCTFCGVLRRSCLNAKARELGANYLATGLNLDDTAQSILMNFIRGDVERLARMGPHKKVQPGLVPRIQPLRMIPEKESYLYAMVSGIDFHDAPCPYADRALRNQYRSILEQLEDRSPGTRFSILSSYDSMAPMLRQGFPSAQLGRCECGEPALGGRCQACLLLERLR